MTTAATKAKTKRGDRGKLQAEGHPMADPEAKRKAKRPAGKTLQETA